MNCYYCHKKIKKADGTSRTFIVEEDIDSSVPASVQHRDRFHCEASPSLMHFPEAYKIVEATPRQVW